MFRYILAPEQPRATVACHSRLPVCACDTTIYIDSDNQSYYLSDSDSDSDEEVVHDFCLKRGTHVIWSEDEWVRTGGCQCGGPTRTKGRNGKEKKKCSLMEWLGVGKEKKKKKMRCRKDGRCGYGGHSRRYRGVLETDGTRERGGHHSRSCACQERCHGGSSGRCREGRRYECSGGGGGSGSRRRGREVWGVMESDGDSGSESERVVFRQRGGRKQKNWEGAYREEVGLRVKVPVDVDLTELRKPMTARVVIDRNGEEDYYFRGGGMEAGTYWEPHILGV